ncbi:MAG TPA: immune inhibitor A [Anaerolineaceae bacterium]|nr:immune inhibitor A [Anaerolineaceae bacterium]HQF45801.1 immune inhibitor A [Anaerolineaceae bacterium]HQH35564.1 immune inhibitor A [Anaerolineaceae bacterium]HQJ03350.1 immune inhibitor A [Anaerolineaceae bacterium]
MGQNKGWVIALIVVLVIGLLCCCVVVVGAGAAGWFVFSNTDEPIPWLESTEIVPFPFFSTPTSPAVPMDPEPKEAREPATDAAYETLETLKNATVPVNDPRDLAERLLGIQDIPLTFETNFPRLGDQRMFWVSNVDTNENFQITANLEYVTDHAYFWIEDGVLFDARELQRLGDAFENQIYPTNREFFGSEWSPGVDNDPHLYILLAGNLGFNLAGYFSSADELHPLAHDYSNAHEMFLLNADNIDLGDEFTYGVLAHEFQHMIHWYTDRNEESWLNEGFSELSSLLNDFDPGGFDGIYAMNPDLQLTDWPDDPDATTPHYGAGLLFTTYFLDRFGEDATKAVVAHPDNGMDSIDTVLQGMNIKDGVTAQAVRADDVFGDWVIANFLQDGSVMDGRYDYSNYRSAPQTRKTETLNDCSGNWQNRNVKQYGVDYIEITCEGEYQLEFSGQTTVGVLKPDAHSGDYAFWSNKGDESNMRLTREFDFTNITGPITFTYWTWYDLEDDYDYLYLDASTDGETWQIIPTPSCTAEDPSGNSYGCGYNGSTNGWRKEEVNLSNFAGQKVWLRFDYVTDAAVNGEGLLLDDMSIPAIGYSTDFEGDDGGWLAEGFVRIQNQLPQTFRVSLIRMGTDTVVETLVLDETQSVTVPVSIGGSIDKVVLVVSGTTRFTRQEAGYSYRMVR